MAAGKFNVRVCWASMPLMAIWRERKAQYYAKRALMKLPSLEEYEAKAEMAKAESGN